MIIPDASFVVELITNEKFARILRESVNHRWGAMAAPHLIDIEVTSALRRLAATSRIDPNRIQQYFTDLRNLPAKRHTHSPLLGRIWELRHNFTAYDAAYVALAETTGAPLYTFDSKLLKGHRAKVVYFGDWIT